MSKQSRQQARAVKQRFEELSSQGINQEDFTRPEFNRLWRADTNDLARIRREIFHERALAILPAISDQERYETRLAKLQTALGDVGTRALFRQNPLTQDPNRLIYHTGQPTTWMELYGQIFDLHKTPPTEYYIGEPSRKVQRDRAKYNDPYDRKGKGVYSYNQYVGGYQVDAFGNGPEGYFGNWMSLSGDEYSPVRGSSNELVKTFLCGVHFVYKAFLEMAYEGKELDFINLGEGHRILVGPPDYDLNNMKFFKTSRRQLSILGECAARSVLELNPILNTYYPVDSES